MELTRGSHTSAQHGLCIMEAAAMLAGEKHSDQPQCVAPTIRTFGMRLNDMMTDTERQRLVPFIHKIIGTAGDEMLEESEQRRAYLCADYAVRVFAPIALRVCGYERQAQNLENLPRVVSVQTARVASTSASAAAFASASAAADAFAATAADADARTVVINKAVELFSKMI